MKPAIIIKSLDSDYQMGQTVAIDKVKLNVSFELISPILGTRTFDYKLINQVQEVDVNMSERSELEEAHRTYERGTPLF